MDATGDLERTTRARAIEGLRAIAQLEEYVAAEIDEAGYFGELAAWLSRSAARRRALVAELHPPEGPAPSLRLVT